MVEDEKVKRGRYRKNNHNLCLLILLFTALTLLTILTTMLTTPSMEFGVVIQGDSLIQPSPRSASAIALDDTPPPPMFDWDERLEIYNPPYSSWVRLDMKCEEREGKDGEDNWTTCTIPNDPRVGTISIQYVEDEK